MCWFVVGGSTREHLSVECSTVFNHCEKCTKTACNVCDTKENKYAVDEKGQCSSLFSL